MMVSTRLRNPRWVPYLRAEASSTPPQLLDPPPTSRVHIYPKSHYTHLRYLQRWPIHANQHLANCRPIFPAPPHSSQATMPTVKPSSTPQDL